MKRHFTSVWIRILSILFLIGFAFNFVIFLSVPLLFEFIVTAKVASALLLSLSAVILFFIILFACQISAKRTENN